MIPKAELEVRGIYTMRQRNLSIAVWTGKEFIGIRTKFGHRFLDSEFHRDDGPPHGTAWPERLVGRLPDEVGLHESEPTVCDYCKKPARWTGPPAPAPWVCEGACTEVRPVAYSNQPMFGFLAGLDGAPST